MTAGANGGLGLLGPIRSAWIVPLGLLLVAFFVYWGFPYARLADFLAARVGQWTGTRVAYEDVGPSLQLAGPGVGVRGLRATLSGGETLLFDRAALRPAWALAWLRGRPALHTRLQGASGSAEGVFTLGASGGYAGDLVGVDFTTLPQRSLWPGVLFEGRLDARIDLHRGPGGPEGHASFEAVDGTVAMSGFPMAFPYEKLRGELRFGDGSFLEVETLTLEGPLLRAEVTGRVNEGLTFETAPLQLQVQLEAEPPVRNALRMAGVRLGEDGTARVRIAGNLNRPLVR